MNDGNMIIIWKGFQSFPCNNHIPIDPLLEVDLVYISHSHRDHFDPWFLKQLPKNQRFIIAYFHDPDLKESLRELGFYDIIELAEDENFSENNILIKKR